MKSLSMGKFQEEYYMMNAKGKSYMAHLSEKGKELEEKVKTISRAKVNKDIQRKLSNGYSDESTEFVRHFEAGYCPHCAAGGKLQSLLEDYCPQHGDVYECYVAAKLSLEGEEVTNKRETPKLSAAEAAADPAHYKDIVPGYEYMQLMEHLLGYEGTVDHLKGQIYKYLMRCGKKDDPYQEMLKVQWYSNYLTTMMKRKADGDFPYTPKD